jgi:hypothetical protein
MTAVMLISLIDKTVENPVWIQSGKKIQPPVLVADLLGGNRVQRKVILNVV